MSSSPPWLQRSSTHTALARSRRSALPNKHLSFNRPTRLASTGVGGRRRLVERGCRRRTDSVCAARAGLRL